MTATIPALPSDDQVRLHASRQVGRPVSIEKTHISLVRPSDTVYHEGRATTVCPKDIRTGGFMGRTLFGDSYVLGRKPVLRIVMRAGSLPDQETPA